MMYVRFPLSLRQVEDLLSERGIDICHETVRFWWNRFGPLFPAEIRKRRVHRHCYSNWRWHLDEVFVRINGRPTICGALLTTKAKCLRFLPRNGGSQGCTQVSETHDQAVMAGRLRSSRTGFRHTGLRLNVNGNATAPDPRSLAKQPGRKLTSTLSATGTRNGKVQE